MAKGMKVFRELGYWTERKAVEGVLNNSHYEFFYTTHFGLSRSFFEGKKILDIGCGPRGSLEWADMASERIGIDPLAGAYRPLGIPGHQMHYACAGSEKTPFKDGVFDVVCSFNSFDLTDNFEETAEEIVRVMAPKALFLLLTNIPGNRPVHSDLPAFSWDIIDKFSPPLNLIEEVHFEKSENGIYESLRKKVPFRHKDLTPRYGVLSAKFTKAARNSSKGPDHDHE